MREGRKAHKSEQEGGGGALLTLGVHAQRGLL